MRRSIGCCIAIGIGLLISGAAFGEAVDPLGVLFQYQWIGNIDQTKFVEPSGITLHKDRGTLFVVSDEGYIEEIQRDGTPVQQQLIRKADFEGVTSDPSTGLLYLAIEGEEKIIEVNPDDFSVTREFVIDRTFQGRTVLKKGGQGIECIAFVPDANHPEGGTFYVGNQSFDLADSEDLSAIFEVEVPLRSRGAGEPTATIIRYLAPGVIDLSGIHHDKASDHLYVISDATNTLLEMTRAGEVLRAFAFPGQNQEGIAVDENGNVFVAQDSGGIVKMKWDAYGK
jgi:hypothetical protein